MDKPLSRRLSSPPTFSDLGPPQLLPPVAPGDLVTLPQWQEQQPGVLAQWQNLLGKPAFSEDYDKTARITGTVETADFRGVIYQQPTGPHSSQKVLLMLPLAPSRQKRPGAIVPFYHPDDMAGYRLDSGARIRGGSNVYQFGLHLVRQGFIVVCPEAFPFNTVPEPANNTGFAWWQAAADKLKADHPQWTGMGKLVHDARRAVDLLLAQPDVDAQKTLIIGHSLGGKISFYTSSLDSRIQATIASDFGIGWSFTNWTDPWYLGPQVAQANFPLANHQLLALHAPRPFLLIAGEADDNRSWQYLLEAQKIYRLYGCCRIEAIGCFNHATGHSPTPEAMRLAYRWLAEQLDMPAVEVDLD